MQKKRIISLLMALCLCLSLITTAFAQGTVLTVSAPEELPAVGETFEVTVSISGNPGFAAVEFVLSFDRSAVECMAITRGSLTRNMFGAENPAASSGAKLGAASASPVTQDGVLSVCTFKVLSEASPAFSLDDIVLSYEDGSPIPHSISIPNFKATAPEAPPRGRYSCP